MTDFPSQHDLDDELLSAYLDGELSASERAAVEARLAADPAAQELLDQLRSVSRAVQNLPTESVGHDLSAAIRRRLEPTLPMTGHRGESISLTLPLVEDSPWRGEGRGDDTLPLPLGEGRGEGESAVTSSFTSPPLKHNIKSATNVAHPLPPLTIGRTRRGWVWASLAAAAALWIMVFQPGREARQGGPLLARRGEPNEGSVANETRSAARPQGELEFRALDEQLARPSNDLLAEHDAAASRGREIADLESNAAVPASPAPPSANDELAAADPAFGVGTATSAPPDTAHFAGGRGSAAASAAPANGAPATVGDAVQLVVVRVLAKQSALQNKAFDQVLASNGIALEGAAAPAAAGETQPTAAPLAAAAPADGYAESAAPAAEAEQVAETRSQPPVAEEAVLVEASPTTLFACIESINQDSQNFSGVTVDDAAANVTADGVAVVEASDESLTPLAANAKQRASDLGLTRFNRGVVPKQQRQLSRETTQFYYLVAPQNDPLWRDSAEAKIAGGRGGYGGGYGGQAGYGGRGGYGPYAPAEPVDKRTIELSLEDRQWAANSMGWAIRLQAASGETLQTVAGQQPTRGNLPLALRGETLQTAAGQQPSRRVAAPAESVRRENVVSLADAAKVLPKDAPQPAAPQDFERLQVLFVLSPEEPPPSPPAENRPE